MPKVFHLRPSLAPTSLGWVGHLGSFHRTYGNSLMGRLRPESGLNLLQSHEELRQ